MSGETVSHYRILEELGGGGMGVVYRAEDLVLGRSVAIKFLPDALAEDALALERFQREARAASALNHPHICTVHELGEEDGRLFLVMELMEGRTLKHLLDGSPLAPEKVVRLGAQVSDALDNAHRHGIVHRDIKPANLFVSSRFEAKVLDFGLAMLNERSRDRSQATDPAAPTELAPATLTVPGTVMGTIGYMSPEQVRGEVLDHRTDLFSLGVVLYEMVTGRQPFAGATSGVVFEKILNHEPARVTRLEPDVPAELDRVLAKALEKDRDLRYQSAADLRVDLDRLQQVDTVVQQPAPAPEPARGRVLRRVWGLAGAAVLLAAGGWWLQNTSRSPPPAAPVATVASGPSIAVLPLVNISDAKEETEYFADGLAEELINVLSQIPELRVAGRTSSFQFKDKNEDLRRIAEQLGVSSVLEGSVRKAGETLRISVKVVDAEGLDLWVGSYDRELDDILAVQDDIARSVAEALELTLLNREDRRIQPRGSNAEAYNLMLQGRYFSDRRNEAGLERAVDYYQRALAIDPEYALAWALLGEALVRQGSFGFVSFDQAFLEAKRMADRAIAIDPDLPEAWTLVARVKVGYEWDWAGATEASRRATLLAPGDADINASLALVARTVGALEESIAHSRESIALDPLSIAAYGGLTSNLYYAGRYEEAEEAGRRVLELSPGRPVAHYRLALIHLSQGEPAEALAELDNEPFEPFRLHGQSLALTALGREEEADDALDQLISGWSEEAAYQIAEVHAARGEADLAFEWLDRAIERRDTGLADAAISPLLGNLHGDPRWPELLDRLGLPQAPSAG